MLISQEKNHSKGLILILHGWQSSKEKWQEVKENLEKQGLKVIVPDIPGFKPDTSLKIPWTLDDYLRWFGDFLEQQEETCLELRTGFFLLGHSFGGRIAIKFAEKYPERLKGLILVSAAGIKRKPSKILMIGAKIVRELKIIVRELKIEEEPFLNGLWQFFRNVFYNFILRRTDYLKASGALRRTMSNIVSEDLRSLLPKIIAPTLIIWGKRDKLTPLKDGYLMKEKIKNSRLEILENIGHTPHLENPELLAEKIKNFILNK